MRDACLRARPLNGHVAMLTNPNKCEDGCRHHGARYLAHSDMEKFKGFCCVRCFEYNVPAQTLLQAAPKGIHCKLNDGRPEAMAKRSMVRNANMKKGLPVWWSMRSTPQTRRASFHGAAGVRTGQSHSWRHEVSLASPMGAPVFEKKVV